MNRLFWAVAGGRKTQAIIDHCARSESSRLRLALTFTRTGQSELVQRLHRDCPPSHRPEVQGWFTFLMKHWIRPYLPTLYPATKDTGFSFDGDPGRYATGLRAYFDTEGRLYRRNLARLAWQVNQASGGSVIQRLERIYSEILIDEVQDLCGWDLEVIDLLLNSSIQVRLVGDPRQCVYSTNAEDRKNSAYRGAGVVDWFEKRRAKLQIETAAVTYRSIQEIADLADTVFPDARFPPTRSAQGLSSAHQGIFWVHPAELANYREQFAPLVLAWDTPAREKIPGPARNFGDVKGVTAPHVVIKLTTPMRRFLSDGTQLKDTSASKFYVAITRAVFSVAFLSETPVGPYPRWVPE